MIDELASNIAALKATLARHGLGTLVAIEVDGLQLSRIQRAAEDNVMRQAGMITANKILGVVLKAKAAPRSGW